MARRREQRASWLDALAATKMEVRSARDAAQVVGWLDSGNFALNWAVSGRFCRGLPYGRSVEFFGDPATGKSFLMDRAIAMCQAQGGAGLLDDPEGSRIDERMAGVGIDVDALAMRHSSTVKEHLATAQQFFAAFREFGAPWGVLCCDSLSQISTEHEMEVQLDKRDMTKAAELKAFFRIITPALLELPVIYLCSSHIIASPGQMFQQRTTSGGGGPKYSATVRIDLRTPSKLKVGNEYVGVMCRAVVDKNRISPPWREVRLVIPFYQPISRASGLIDVLTAMGIIEQRGEFLWCRGKKVGRYYKPDDKTHALQKDQMGEELLDREPELLEEADAQLAAAGPHMMQGPLAEDRVSAEDADEVAEQ